MLDQVSEYRPLPLVVPLFPDLSSRLKPEKFLKVVVDIAAVGSRSVEGHAHQAVLPIHELPSKRHIGRNWVELEVGVVSAQWSCYTGLQSITTQVIV